MRIGSLGGIGFWLSFDDSKGAAVDRNIWLGSDSDDDSMNVLIAVAVVSVLARADDDGELKRMDWS